MQNWTQHSCPSPDLDAKAAAENHQRQLTKPLGSLGRLEDMAISFAAWQRTTKPRLDRIAIRVFAADHGVAAQGVSAFPQSVTAQMVSNFLAGGAAISVLARSLNADFAAVNLGTVETIPSVETSTPLFDHPIAQGTQDFTLGPAMSEDELNQALLVGKQQIEKQNFDLFIGGEMGIGNTTSASAIYCALLGLSAEDSAGPGTGVDDEGVQRKISAIKNGLEKNSALLDSPMGILQAVGGFEIAALTGAYIASAQQQVPILVDGFICTAAALLACQINPTVRPWMLFAHRSAEPAHQLALQALDAEPLLDLGLRLGEGSGAASAVSLLQSALALHNSMATFSSAGVSNRDE